jgi:hypothetical protein
MPQYLREMGCTPEELIRWLPQALGSLYPQTSLVIDGDVLLSAANTRFGTKTLFF